jgi:phosphoribosylaminoimidazolecarboxamide formyltransferase/IMP cyclohydrolase
VATDPAQYPLVMAEMAARDGATSDALRRRLAALAFAHTAAYDAAIAAWMAAQQGEEGLPERIVLDLHRAALLRYGENPHQAAALYIGGPPRPGVATAAQVQGKALSYNNLNDTDAAFECVAEVADSRGQAAVVIVKHANPCGVAVAATLAEAHRRALACDPVSAFGGIVAASRTLDAATARAIAEVFTEVVIAPDAEAEARAVLAGKANLRLLLAGGLPDPAAPGLRLSPIAGGYLAQTRDAARIGPGDLRVVTRRAPDARELDDLLFAFRVAKHVKSNAIVYARDGATVGIGAGQMSRVDAARIAAWKAREAAEAAGETGLRTEGAVVASDAFFPFADGLLAAAEAGVTAVIQPGGSVRDDEVIAAADEAGLAMVFTGVRHFRH